ncbi:hypothetical protein EI94DRAFT_1707752 [Lactarius quietus]|nr:hypothetical protein EI94DRAFT_1707752 [Lactarius quietus]
MTLASNEELDGYHAFCHMMTTLMFDARSSDTNCLVSHVITYIPCELTAPSIASPLLLNDKSKHGWNHNLTAAVLCSLKMCATFLNDPLAFCNSVQSGTRTIKMGDYPCFLYPEYATYDHNDCAKGLFQGHIFIKMHYALSDIRSWADISRSSFNYPKFFKNIVKLFRNQDSTWVKETPEHVTSELPVLKCCRRNQQNTSNLDSDQDSKDNTEAMLAQQQDNTTGEPQEDDNNAVSFN